MNRPRSVTVFAIINLIIGGLGVIGFAWWLVMRLNLIPIPGQESNPAVQAMKDNPAYRLFTDLSTILGLVATVVCIAAAIGLLKLQPWARLATIGWAVYHVCMSAIGAVLSHLIITGPMLAKAEPNVKMGLMIGLGVGYCFAVIMLGYFILMIVMLSRPRIKEAFAGADAKDIV